jgi:uncharacterized protein with ParB-like and HNH nuclease domain
MNKVLKLDDISKKINIKNNVNKGTSVWVYFKDIFDEDYKVDFDIYLPSKGMNLQRPLVWTLFQKQQFILSLLKDIPIPHITVIQYKEYPGVPTSKSLFKIIDGKQRITTMIMFYQNEFPIIWEGVEYFYNNLDIWAQRKIKHKTVIGDVYYEYPDERLTDDQLIELFEQINWAGTPQDLYHINSLKNNIYYK